MSAPEAFHFIDALHTPFSMSATLYSDALTVDLAALAGAARSVSLPLPDGKDGLLWGVAVAARQEETTPQATRSSLELRPWAALLADAPSCAVYQNKTVPEIVKEAARKQGFADIRESLSKTPRKREFTVQYNESTLDFLSRIMAEDGIFYYFEHGKQKHVMVLADDSSGLAKLPDMTWRGANAPGTPDNLVWDVRPERRAGIASVKVDDHNCLTPKTSLAATSGSGTPQYHVNGAGHSKQQEGGDVAKRFLDAAASGAFTLYGKTCATTMRVGGVFTLKNCPIRELNASWAVISLDMAIRRDGSVDASFVAVPPAACRPPLPARPRVAGPMTGVVTGKSGEEATTDEYGRVKARLHWDREGKTDETASCWLRVAQPWAGAGYGAFFLPRAGQEVLVEFLDGNPDRPVIAGCLYNGTAKPPWKLPDNASVSGILGRSMPDGDGGNEISLDDKKDKERLYFHAKKLLECLVGDTRSITISGESGDEENSDVLVIAKGSRSAAIKEGNDALVMEKGSRSATIKEGNDALVMEKGSRSAAIKEGSEALVMEKGSRSVSIKEGNDALKLEKGNRSVALEKGDDSLSVKGKRKLEIKGDYEITVGGNLTLKAGSISFKSDKAFDVDAKSGVTLKTNASLKATATGGLDLETKAELKLDGMNVAITGKTGSIDGGGMLQLKGGMVKIN